MVGYAMGQNRGDQKLQLESANEGHIVWFSSSCHRLKTNRKLCVLCFVTRVPLTSVTSVSVTCAMCSVTRVPALPPFPSPVMCVSLPVTSVSVTYTTCFVTVTPVSVTCAVRADESLPLHAGVRSEGHVHLVP